MSDALTKAKSWEIATVRKNNNGKVYLSFAKDVTIKVGDREVDLGEFNTLFLDDALANVEYLLSNEHIDQDEANKRVKTIEDKGIQRVVRAKLI